MLYQCIKKKKLLLIPTGYKIIVNINGTLKLSIKKIIVNTNGTGH